MSGNVPTLGRIVWFYARRLPGRTDQQAARGCGAELDYTDGRNPAPIVPAMIVAATAPSI